MNDEMKEPDEEKALSESDERKPDFKAEQFSDGASGTSSSEIPPSNEDDGARKNEENDSLLTRAIHKLGNKKRAAIAAAVAVVIIFSLPMLFPQLFCSHKLWANATCTSPRVCKKLRQNRGRTSRARMGRSNLYDTEDLSALRRNERGATRTPTGLVDQRSRLRRCHFEGNTRMREMRRGR